MVDFCEDFGILTIKVAKLHDIYTINMLLSCVQIFVVSCVLPLMAFGGVYKYYFMHENTLGSDSV